MAIEENYYEDYEDQEQFEPIRKRRQLEDDAEFESSRRKKSISDHRKDRRNVDSRY